MTKQNTFLASENASFGQPEVGLGITPGCGGTQRLARFVGAGKAKEIPTPMYVVGLCMAFYLYTLI